MKLAWCGCCLHPCRLQSSEALRTASMSGIGRHATYWMGFTTHSHSNYSLMHEDNCCMDNVHGHAS